MNQKSPLLPNLKYIQGNIFSSTNRQAVLAHAVNIRGVYGAGVALQVSKKYPEAKAAYLKKFKEVGWNLGDVQFVVLAEKIVCNMALQANYGRVGVFTRLDACKIAFDKLFDYCDQNNYSVSMPMVGSGLGGERWENVEEKLIESLEVFPSVNVEVYYL